jgi:predicted glycogen debranching enzyme
MLAFGREITGHFQPAASREWLATNGLGGWASGTVSGANTRRYHGFFVPALQPPLGRTVLVSKLDEWARVGEQLFSLGCNEFADGTVAPRGYRHIESFQLDLGVPTWTYALAEALLEKRLWMPHGQNTALVTYTLRRTPRPVQLTVRAFITGRDVHGETRASRAQGGAPTPEVTTNGARACCQAGGIAFYLTASHGAFTPTRRWRRNIKHRVETERGLPDQEDHFEAGEFTTTLHPGETLALAATLTPAADLGWEAALAAEHARAAGLITRAGLEAAPAWVRQLVLAADQFIVRRGAGHTVIAGYPWFGDWGRDTMIALPGLMLTTRRYDVAADTLRTFARFVSQGMLPNRFPEQGETPEYNTVDATLWYFHAVQQYVEATGDLRLARDLFPVLEDMLAWHVRGTRYNIHLDPADDLLYQGEAGAQLTWMDVKIGDWVVTPRTGKPVEINALWINALRVTGHLCRQLGVLPRQPYADMAERSARSFGKFWYAAGRYLYDVIEGPQGDDAALRPNQLIALALPYGPWAGPAHAARARELVELCAAHLLTSYGLRSLSPGHPDYRGVFTGDQRQRDAVYHQGTVWGWLIGPLVDAYLLAGGDADAHASVDTARSWLAPFEHHLADFGLGSVAEVFDGDAPFAPRGCPAQAWSVAEVLRAWVKVSRLEQMLPA